MTCHRLFPIENWSTENRLSNVEAATSRHPPRIACGNTGSSVILDKPVVRRPQSFIQSNPMSPAKFVDTSDVE